MSQIILQISQTTLTNMAFKGPLLIVFGIFGSQLLTNALVLHQPKHNLWVTLANITRQETLCLSVASPDNPFPTGLVGLPTIANWENAKEEGWIMKAWSGLGWKSS